MEYSVFAAFGVFVMFVLIIGFFAKELEIIDDVDDIDKEEFGVFLLVSFIASCFYFIAVPIIVVSLTLWFGTKYAFFKMINVRKKFEEWKSLKKMKQKTKTVL